MKTDRFEGREVKDVIAVVKSANPALNMTLAADPKIQGIDEEGYLVLKYRIGAIKFLPNKLDDQESTREQTYDVLTAAFIDKELVSHIIEEQYDRNFRHDQEAKGIYSLPIQDGE